MTHTIITTFAMFFVLTSPLSNMFIFERLTADFDAKTKRIMAYKSIFIAFFVLLFFGLTGESLFKYLRIEMSAFRLCGGLLLVITAMEMIHEKRVQKQSDSADNFVQNTTEDISACPMAVPLLAGPGAITSIIMMMDEGDLTHKIIIFATVGVIMLISLVLFLCSTFLTRFIGVNLNHIISRLLGIILLALSVQFIIDAIRTAFYISS